MLKCHSGSKLWLTHTWCKEIIQYAWKEEVRGTSFDSLEIGIELGKGMNINILREESNTMQKRIRTMDDIEHDRRHRMH